MTRRKILIASFDLAIGGVERSLIGLLNQLDYSKYDVDLMLFRHEGEFFPMVPRQPNLLREVPQYASFRKSIGTLLQERNYPIGMSRLMAKSLGSLHGKLRKSAESGYLVIQYGWLFSLPFLPQLEQEYDAAISFLWPHYFVGEKVRARTKLGWVHTDYSRVDLHKSLEQRMWGKMDHIVAVSDGCRDSFVAEFPAMKHKVGVIENMISPDFVRLQAAADVEGEMPAVSGRINLVTVGRLSYAKGLDEAARACRALLDRGWDVAWYVVGYGPLEHDLQQLIHELGLEGRFVLLGKKINPYPYMRACDIYVQPSRYEGKAVTVREAQILGKPVLITDFATARSQVCDGVDGLIAPMGAAGLVQGLERMMADPALTARLAASTEARDYGNSTEVAKLYELLEAAAT